LSHNLTSKYARGAYFGKEIVLHDEFSKETPYWFLDPFFTGYRARALFFQSITLFSLTLGADSLFMDEPCEETLGFSGCRILTGIFVTQADIITCASSIDHRQSISPDAQRSPTEIFSPTVSADCLVPFHFRRKNTKPVSYYALFKRWLLPGKLPGYLCVFTSFNT